MGREKVHTHVCQILSAQVELFDCTNTNVLWMVIKTAR